MIKARDNNRPLADRLRPQQISEVVGQPQLIGNKGKLSRLLERGSVPSLLFWGPPGTGKTTIARLIAQETAQVFVPLSAVFSGVSDMRKQFEMARQRRAQQQSTLLFIDEIHRFNRGQQDALLPVIEDGTVTFLAATTENPGFAINSALLSRLQVFTLRSLDVEALEQILLRAETALGHTLLLTDQARQELLAQADGDGRQLLNMAEIIATRPDAEGQLDSEAMLQWLGDHPLRYDKTQDEHYNLISALHKSLRGSHTDAALYWLARMLAGGEDGNYIARRLLRFAYEDIGLAEPAVAQEVLCAWQTYERLGSPEGELALATAVIRLGTAPKSNAAYVALKNAQRLAKQRGTLAPPKNIINPANKFMKSEGFGEGYIYEHDVEGNLSRQPFYPNEIPDDTVMYQPVERGFEREIQKRLEYFRKVRHSAK